MKIEIKIEADEDSVEKIQKKLNSIYAGIGMVARFFEQFEVDFKSAKKESSTDIDVSVGKEAVTSLDEDAEPSEVMASTSPEKKSALAKSASKSPLKKKTKQTKTVTTSKKSKANKKLVRRKTRVTAGSTVLKYLKKSDGGLDSKTLEEKTGFSAKKVADTVYKLKKNGLIQKTGQGVFVTI